MEMGNGIQGDVSTKLRVLTGVFGKKEDLENAYGILIEKGYPKNEISLIMSNNTRDTHFESKKSGTDIEGIAIKDIGTSSAVGGTIGVVTGVAIALGAGLLVPGVGLLIAGPIAAGLVAGGAGGITGGIIGALVGSGVAEDHAKLYENEVTSGRMVMGVHPRSEEDADYFEKSWRENNAQIIFRERME